MNTLPALAAALASGSTSSRALVEDCLTRIADPAGEGGRVFLKLHADAALTLADTADALHRTGRAPSAFAGIPISVKDLFDIAGDSTPAGSVVLADAPPATTTAPAVARLEAAGFIVLGRTNMVEFAFSGLGINPHFGTPRSPWDRATGRIPGGSTSGGAVSVSDGMAYAALGTDTGGSCRVPAAMCGIVGFKPTARRVPITGVLPLAPSLDSVGPLANSVACCAIIDALMAGGSPGALDAAPLAGLRLAVPSNIVLGGLDDIVAAAFVAALKRLEAAGARIVDHAFPAMDEVAPVNARGGLTAPESYAWHRRLMVEAAMGYDPRILKRIERGIGVSAADYLDTLAARAAIIARMDAQTQDFDALIMPTCPLVPPAIADLDDEADYNRVNLLQLRNTSMGNFLDRCAISLPCHAAGATPVGLMLMGETMGDARLLRIAAGVEAVLAASS
jgi:aspartyl-tRNA(Asn)/glutamyl-tRNA(Gln) amidotransferase subunit A